MTIALDSSTLIRQKEKLAELIKHLTSSGWSLKDLSDLVGVDSSTMCRWSKGKTIPEQDSKNFYQLAKVSGGSAVGLQLYLEGKISLSSYCNRDYIAVEEKIEKKIKINENLVSQELKIEILSKIRSLDPVDIAEVIASSLTYLVKK